MNDDRENTMLTLARKRRIQGKNLQPLFIGEKVAELTMYFEKLVYDPDPKVRQEFRNRLGSRWERFLNLTRALVGETAREVTFNEGRLKKDTEAPNTQISFFA